MDFTEDFIKSHLLEHNIYASWKNCKANLSFKINEPIRYEGIDYSSVGPLESWPVEICLHENGTLELVDYNYSLEENFMTIATPEYENIFGFNAVFVDGKFRTTVYITRKMWLFDLGDHHIIGPIGKDGKRYDEI